MIVLGIDVPGRKVGGFAIYDSKRDACPMHRPIHLLTTESESQQLLRCFDELTEIAKLYRVELIALEHPFLYLIAQWIGAVKLWASFRDIPWYMVTASSARKAVYGHAKRITRLNKNGREVSAAKEFVLGDLSRRYANRIHPLTQHTADALLYAIAAAKRTVPNGS